MENKLKKRLIRLIISFIFFIGIIISSKFIDNWIIIFILYLLNYLLCGYDVIIKCFKNVIYGNIFDENFLMVFASFGAFGLGIYNSINGNIEGFSEAVAVILFYQVGEWFEKFALGKSRKSISSLMDIRPDYANLIIENNIKIIDPSTIKINDIILVKPGEKVPLDGIVVDGNSSLDYKALTGESIPKNIKENEEILSGAINLNGTLKIKVTKLFYDSTVNKILDLIENASTKKSKKENFITSFAKIYTPFVVISAVLLFILGSLITKNISSWLYRSLSFLVVSCPCALVISIPLSFFSGIGGASKKGILIKGSNYLETFNKTNIFVFDKTGTLTKGNFEIISYYPNNKKNQLLKYASICEYDSTHPIAKSILKEYKEKIDNTYNIENISGKGIKAIKNNDVILCGNDKLMDQYHIKYNKITNPNTIIHVSFNNEYIGYILIGDQLKDESKIVIDYLNNHNYKTYMLTGDNKEVASSIAKKLNIQNYKSNLLPLDKVNFVEELINNKKDDENICFIGDGINDAPVLIRSDIGISMGNIGSDAAIEASDIVLMKDNLKEIITAKNIAKKTMNIVNQNIIIAISIKLFILILNAIGYGSMWASIFGDVGVAAIAILNASRALKIKKRLVII